MSGGHLVDRVHDSPSGQNGPDPVDDGAGKGRIFLYGEACEFRPAGELGDGCPLHLGRYLWFLAFFLLPGRIDPIGGGSDLVKFRVILFPAPAWFLDNATGEEDEFTFAALTLEVCKLVVAPRGPFP